MQLCSPRCLLIFAEFWPGTKPGKCDDVTFLKRIIWAFLVVRQHKWHFWNSETKLDKTGRYVFKRKFRVSKFDLFDLNLTWPCVRYANESHHLIVRPKWFTKHVSNDTCAIFSSGDLIWPDLDLDLYLPLTACLHVLFIIPSVAFWFGVVAVSGLVSAADKGMRVSFDLCMTLTRYLTLLRKL